MRELYIARLKQELRHEAYLKAKKNPEYQDIEKQINEQIKELNSKKDEALKKLTDKYYKEMKDERGL